jgi:hypothetical protein
VATVLAVFFACCVAMFDPYSDIYDTYLYVIGCFVIFCTMLMSTLAETGYGELDDGSFEVIGGLMIAMNLFIISATVSVHCTTTTTSWYLYLNSVGVVMYLPCTTLHLVGPLVYTTFFNTNSLIEALIARS